MPFLILLFCISVIVVAALNRVHILQKSKVVCAVNDIHNVTLTLSKDEEKLLGKKKCYNHSRLVQYVHYETSWYINNCCSLHCCYIKYVWTNDTVSHSLLCWMCTHTHICDMCWVFGFYLRWACACLSILLCLFVCGILCALQFFSLHFLLLFFSAETLIQSGVVSMSNEHTKKKNITLNLLIAYTN